MANAFVYTFGAEAPGIPAPPTYSNRVLQWTQTDGLGNLKIVRSGSSSGVEVTAVTLTYDVLGNLKTTLAGAYHSLKYRKYAAHYLAAFAYRFNRRFDLRDLVSCLIVDVDASRLEATLNVPTPRERASSTASA